MSKGAIFNLIVRDERFDKFITQSDALRKRLDQVRAARAARKDQNVQPTIADVEKTHVFYTRASYKPYVAVASEYTQARAQGDGATYVGPSSSSVQFTFPNVGHFTSDMAVRVRFKEIGSADSDLLYRYCAYPGIRLFKSATLSSDKMIIDEYTRDDVAMRAKFFLNDDFQTGFDRCMGQQDLRTAEFFNSNGFTGVMYYRDGAQTPRPYQPALEMWVPLQFWMCRDPSQALVNDLIPNTQREITLTLAPITEIVQATTADGTATSLPFQRLQMEISLYVNNLYVNPEIYDIMSSRVGFQLIRCHRSQYFQLQQSSGRVLVNNLKFPTEYLMIGVRDRANSSSFDDWMLMGKRRVRTDATALLSPAAIWNAGIGAQQLVIRSASEATTLDPVVDTLGMIVSGITFFGATSTLQYNAYFPQRYLKRTLTVSPGDSSVWLFPLCLYPGKNDPSGSYNLSTGREMYITYTGAQITPQTPAEMVVSASALNFLIRKGDSFILKYTL